MSSWILWQDEMLNDNWNDHGKSFKFDTGYVHGRGYQAILQTVKSPDPVGGGRHPVKTFILFYFYFYFFGWEGWWFVGS